MFHQEAPSLFIPSSTAYNKGKFGRIFPWLPPCNSEGDALKDMNIIAEMMPDQKETAKMPAGYTYLGQFIAHDLSFDATSLKEREIDREYFYNFRTPALDMDSLYGGGPLQAPHIYRFVKPQNADESPYWLFNVEGDCPKIRRIDGENGMAVIADPRNAENVVIAHLTAAFMVIHNYFTEKLKTKDTLKRFSEARTQTLWHYQWVVLWDYLPRIVGKKLVKKILKKGRKYYDWKNEPFIPLEFSAAAFRFGHTQVKKNYKFVKDGGNNQSIFSLPSQVPCIDWSLFFFKQPQHSNPVNLNLPIKPAISDAIKYLKVNEAEIATLGDLHRDKILDELVNDLKSNTDEAVKDVLIQFALETGIKINERNLAFRNLQRGNLLRLPSGQSVARAMKKKPLIIDKPQFPEHLRGNTPLWYYILFEAEKVHDGAKLGPVGARIVAEVVIGMMQGDKSSFLKQYPKWKPEKIRNGASEFTMIDLLKMAGLYPTS